MNAVIDNGMALKKAFRIFGVSPSFLRDHLYGKTEERHRVIKPTLKLHKEKKLVDYVFKMQDLGHPLTLVELYLMVVVATKRRSIPWNGPGVPGKGRLRQFRRRHPELDTRRS